MERKYTIGEAAELLKVSRDTLRFYEKKKTGRAEKRNERVSLLFGRRYSDALGFAVSSENSVQHPGYSVILRKRKFWLYVQPPWSPDNWRRKPDPPAPADAFADYGYPAYKKKSSRIFISIRSAPFPERIFSPVLYRITTLSAENGSRQLKKIKAWKTVTFMNSGIFWGIIRLTTSAIWFWKSMRSSCWTCKAG